MILNLVKSTVSANTNLLNLVAVIQELDFPSVRVVSDFKWFVHCSGKISEPGKDVIKGFILEHRNLVKKAQRISTI